MPVSIDESPGKRRPLNEGQPSGWPARASRTVGRGSHPFHLAATTSAEDRARGEDMVGEATRIGVLFADAPPGLVHQESVEDVGGFVDGSPAEARRLLEVIDTGTLAGLRDRALLSVMLYSFARVNAVVAMRRANYFRQESRGWLRLHEKGGKRHDVPAHHRAAEAIDDYVEAAISRRGKGAAFPNRRPAGAEANGEGAVAASRPGHDQAAGGGSGSAGVTCCHTFGGDGDHGVLVERRDARARAADRRARVAEDDEALRPDGGHDHRRRDPCVQRRDDQAHASHRRAREPVLRRVLEGRD